MAIKFLGNSSGLLLQNVSDAGELMAGVCNRNLEYERNRELIEKTTLQGYEVGHVLGLKRGSVTFNNLSVFMEPGDVGYYDELCRQWFESGALLLCKLRDEVGTDIREIIFFGYMESYRIVRNQKEPANFDITIRQTDYDSNITCPIVTITNVNASGVFEIDYSFPTTALTTEYTVQLLDEDNIVLQTDTYTTFGDTITGTFSGVESDVLYSIKILIDGLDDVICPGEPFLSFNVPCPVLTLDVGETGVDVTLVPDPLITRVSVQILDDLDPLNVLDAQTLNAPFPDPYTASFTGLSTTTTYWARVYQRIVVDSVVEYAKFCGVVEFTTGTPYVPPTATSFSVIVSNIEDAQCEGLALTVWSDSEAWALGMNLYYNEALTNPLDDFLYVVFAGDIYTLDSEGIVQTDTGLNCP